MPAAAPPLPPAINCRCHRLPPHLAPLGAWPGMPQTGGPAGDNGAGSLVALQAAACRSLPHMTPVRPLQRGDGCVWGGDGWHFNTWCVQLLCYAT